MSCFVQFSVFLRQLQLDQHCRISDEKCIVLALSGDTVQKIEAEMAAFPGLCEQISLMKSPEEAFRAARSITVTDGHNITQTGTFERLRRNPLHRDIAVMLSRPGINLLQDRRSGRDTEIGVYSEDLTMTCNADARWCGRVRHLEAVGRRTLGLVELDSPGMAGQSLRLWLSPELVAAPGDHVSIDVDERQVIYFDRETGFNNDSQSTAANVPDHMDPGLNRIFRRQAPA